MLRERRLSSSIEVSNGFNNSGPETSVVERKSDLSHTGKYMVRAVNSGGEAQSIADMAVFEPTPDTMVEVVKTVVFEDVRKHETLQLDKSTNTVSSTEQVDSSVSLKKPTEPPKPTIPIQIEPPSPKSFELPKQIETKKEVEIVKSEKLLSAESSVKSTESQFSSSKTEFSSFVEKSIKQESQTMKIERSTPLTPLEPPAPAKQEPEPKQEKVPFESKRETEYEIVHEIQAPKVEETGIETSSITKQQSLDFFVKKMKESDETPIPKELPKVTPIKQELYTKFEDSSKSERIEIQKPEIYKETKIEVIKTELPKLEIRKVEIPKPETRKSEIPKSEILKPLSSYLDRPTSEPQKIEVVQLETPKVEAPKPKVEVPISHFEQTVQSEIVQRTPTPTTPTKFEPLPRYTMTSTTYKQYSSLSSSSQQKYEEFSLTPEPPAEICYEPRKSDEIIEKGKRLQESYKEIASAEIPTSEPISFQPATSAKQGLLQT
ncbi:hypothetical protein Trydic_g9135 [Trypoxylus dichotomus]